MKNQYRAFLKQWCLVALWAMALSVTTRAQPVQPPVIQWQTIVELTYSNTASQGEVQAVKASNGGYAVLTADIGTILRLSANGDIIWQKKKPTIIDELYGSIFQATGFASTSDGGFVVLAQEAHGWTLARVDANGNRVWVKPLDSQGPGQSNTPIRRRSLISTSDGGFLDVGSIDGLRSPNIFYSIKYDKNGEQVWEVGDRYSEGAQPNETLYSVQANRAIETNDGGFLVIGTATPYRTDTRRAFGWVAKLDSQGKIIGQKLYDYLSILTGITPTPYGPDGYIATGINANGVGTSTLFVNLNGNGDNTSGTFRTTTIKAGFNKTPGIVSTGQTSHEVFDIADQNNGDFRLVSYNQANETRWIKTLGGSGLDDARSIIATDDGGYLVAGVTTSTDGDVKGKSQNNLATWIVKMSPAAPANALTLTQPTYNCQTGAITFNTSGGDGTPITYTAPGITRANVTDNVGTVEAGLRGDPKPITIQATQNDVTVNYTFDLRTFCNNNPQPPQPPVTPPATGGTLTLSQPTYNCQTGAITFNTTGGNGTSIVYTAPGITRSAATDNTGYIEAGLRGDPKPITITATQSGQTVSYLFDFGAFCRIRPAALPPVFVHAIASQTLTVGQPVTGRSIDLGSAFLDPTVVVGPYMSDWQIQINGIPFGLTPPANDQNLAIASPQLYLTGTPTITGVYTLTIIARTVPFPNQPVATTFTITVAPASATTSTLTLLTPTYDCASGAFTFRSSGGDGSPIEYQAAGITGWTTNLSQFVDKDSRTANDVKPFLLVARQNGQTITYTWDLKAACGRARQQAQETDAPLTLTVLGNPVHEQLRVQIQGADGQPVTLRLTDLTGRLVESRTVLQSEMDQEQVFELHRQGAGLLLLRASSGNRQHTVKVLRQ